MSGFSPRSEIFQCPVDSWFAHYTDSTALEFAVKPVQEFLLAIGLLDKEGWTPITEARAAMVGAGATNRAIVTLAEAVTGAMRALAPELEKKNTIKSIGEMSTKIERYIFKSNLRCYAEPVFITPPLGDCLHRSQQSHTTEQNAMSAETDDFRVTWGIGVYGQVNLLANFVERQSRYKVMEDRDDELQIKIIVRDAAEIMYNDPCRRFINCFTIHGDDVRLWHFDRGHVSRSAKFDLQNEPEYLIRFILYVLTADENQLGYDPTVKRCHVFSKTPGEASAMSYKFTVDNSEYLTNGIPITVDAAYHITSQATRMWIVKKVIATRDDGTTILSDEEYVLKDVWLCYDGKHESQIQSDILRRLSKVDEEEATNYAAEAPDYFMTIIHDWHVEVDGQHDVTFELPLDAIKTFRSPKRYDRRKHVRTVYQEVCATIYELSDFKTLFKTLSGIVRALLFMRKAGYVHRDVNAGNCLWDPESGRGKLSDLEYAGVYGELMGPARTRTPYFLAVECEALQNLFLPQTTRTNEEIETILVDVPRPRSRKFFLYTYYHDLEAVFWIYEWFLHHRLPIALTHRGHEPNIDDLIDSAISIIYHENSAVPRYVHIRDQESSVDLLCVFKELYSPILPAFQGVLMSKITIVSLLRTAYYKLEQTDPVQVDGHSHHWNDEYFVDDPYIAMERIFADLVESTETGALTVYGDVPCVNLV